MAGDSWLAMVKSVTQPSAATPCTSVVRASATSATDYAITSVGRRKASTATRIRGADPTSHAARITARTRACFAEQIFMLKLLMLPVRRSRTEALPIRTTGREFRAHLRRSVLAAPGTASTIPTIRISHTGRRRIRRPLTRRMDSRVAIISFTTLNIRKIEIVKHSRTVKLISSRRPRIRYSSIRTMRALRLQVASKRASSSKLTMTILGGKMNTCVTQS